MAGSTQPAAYNGDVKWTKKLLGRSVNRQLLSWRRHPHGGATALYVACEFGHLEVATILLAAGAAPDQACEDGSTPLYMACKVGRPDTVRLLLKSGAVADQLDSAGMTPLWVACHQGKTELAELLLDAKADPTRKVQGWSPHDLARKDKREELVKLMQETNETCRAAKA